MLCGSGGTFTTGRLAYRKIIKFLKPESKKGNEVIQESLLATVECKSQVERLKGTRVTFSPQQCFSLDGSPEDLLSLQILQSYLKKFSTVTFVGRQQLVDYFLLYMPEIKDRVTVAYINADDKQMGYEISSVTLPPIPNHTKAIFLCETLALHRMQLHDQLEARTPHISDVVDLSILADTALDKVPQRSWLQVPRNIYPVDLPEIRFDSQLDLIVLDCPSRNLALMPNGLGYLNSALKKTSISYQIFDLDIVAYHRFHIHRLFDIGGSVTLPSGRILPEDPWQAEHYDLWSVKPHTEKSENDELVKLFQPLIDETINALVEARPNILGLSIQQCNESISRLIVNGVKAALPDLVLVVGGFSCYNPDIGLKAFPEADYMCIGESDLVVGPLFEALARDERPYNQAGVLSQFDTPDYFYIPGPMIQDLDQIEFPKYEWADLSLYRNFNSYQLTPIIASRGCRWSRCTFCAERFFWRIRSPENFADELEWLITQGCRVYMFNESDLNGMPERVLEICDEIIRRGLHNHIKLTGQLRIHKGSDKAFFQKLAEAGFVALRFGIDAFSENTLRLQKKGYTSAMVSQNLKDCWEAGIYTEVNWVIGVPGETEEDIDEGIGLFLDNAEYIGRLANINPLILVNGGVYWIDPEAHKIKFKAPKEEVYTKYPRALPADIWWSEEPYIDAHVRMQRFEKIATRLYQAGFPVGDWAKQVIEDVTNRKDPHRSAPGHEVAT
jgi:radical SAM superfamily enzyme YgiQ (UPF0313 family)